MRGLRLARREGGMKRKVRRDDDEIRPEYHFDYSRGERGKYWARLMKEGSNVVVLEPDVAKHFRDSDSVNEALRKLLKMSQAPTRQPSRARAAKTQRTRHLRRSS